MNERISIDRVLAKLDDYLGKNDTASAERHLLYWLDETERSNDGRSEILIRNELMGLFRKLGKAEEAFEQVRLAQNKITALGIERQVGSATTYLNCATVYKAFGKAEDALPLFDMAKDIYESDLDETDSRLGGLYNNMALALVDLGRFSEAKELYRKAMEIMRRSENSLPEVAITYLNLASAAEAENGLIEADEEIQAYLDKAEVLLDSHEKRDGHYAFVCEKSASVFGYYGRFAYEKELYERSRRIYNDRT